MKAMFRPGIIVCCLTLCFTKHTYPDFRHTLLSTLNNTDCKILESNNSFLTETLLFGSTSFDTETNTLFLNATIDYILSTEGFKGPFFFRKNPCFCLFFNLFRISLLLLHLSLFFNLIYYFQFIFFLLYYQAP